MQVLKQTTTICACELMKFIDIRDYFHKDVFDTVTL